MLQPARSSRACASHQHPTPAPLHRGMRPRHRANPRTSSTDAKICRIGWRGLSGWSEVSSSASSSSQTCLGHHLSFILLKSAQGECRLCLHRRGCATSPAPYRQRPRTSSRGPAPLLPLAGSPLVTHSQVLLPTLCLMQVDNSCFFCSALKIRWLFALFPHAEELTLSHILSCPPLSYTNRLGPSTLPAAHGPSAQR